MSKKNVEF